MRVTVCELPDDPKAFAQDWERLVEHMRGTRSKLVLLPEMPFAQWFATTPTFDEAVWQRAVASHTRWLARVGDLAPAAVLATRPVDRDGLRLNEGVAWDAALGFRRAHDKAFLPREEGFWESSWYHAGDGTFEPIDVAGALIGFQICTEMWSMGHAQHYGKRGAQLIVVPRATSRTSVEKWVAGGRVAAIVSGAYTMSSSRNSPPDGPDFGGGGWVIAPDGEVLAVTRREAPFQTVDIDLALADRAKLSYPRYVLQDRLF